MKCRLSLIALLLLPVQAQDEREASAPAEPVTSTGKPLSVRLTSGTTLVGRLDPAEWNVRTSFGSLTVPVSSLKLVRFGRKSNPLRLQVVRDAIVDLGSANPDTRTRARVLLKREGAFAGLDLRKASKDHEDPEVRRLTTELLEEMDLDDEELLHDDDRIETRQFNLTGTIEAETFKVTVPELGALTVRRADVIWVKAFEETTEKKFAVSGTHAWPSGWLDTKVAVKKGQKLTITAKGTIHYPNWGQVFTPDGNANMGNINGMTWGTLAARIGMNGVPFRVGSSYTGKAIADGTVHLIVVVQVRGQPSNGEYTVKISQ